MLRFATINSMKILVTGGAGYIGSFMVQRLLQDGAEVAILDSLERGDAKRIPEKATFFNVSLRDRQALQEVFLKPYDAVIHFAAYISVKESTDHPELYLANNVEASKNLFDVMVDSGVKRVVFSSSAAVYGNPHHVPIPEDHTKKPESPYGETKLQVEQMLQEYHEKKGMSSVSLRYFNASGASLDGIMGEAHNPETHIIPCAIQAVRSDSEFTLYGTDYDTPDGTCIRDYIHVLDLAEAHVLALEKLLKDAGAFAYNVGTGRGYSNQDIITTVEDVSEKKMKVHHVGRRAGDPARLIADPTKIQEELGFSPQFSDLLTIVSSAWKWHNKP